MVTNINTPNILGWYPIHIAAKKNDKVVLTALIKSGANINQTTNSKRKFTVREIAKIYNFQDIILILDNFNKENTSSLPFIKGAQKNKNNTTTCSLCRQS